MGKDEEIRTLICQRGQAKRKLTLFKKFFDSFKEEQNPSVTQLRLRVEKLESVYQEFDNVHPEIERCDPEREDENLVEREGFEDSYFKLVSEATDMIDKLTESKWVNGNTFYQQGSAIKLPIIALPEFHGNYDSWISFRDSFTSLIANNAQLSNVQKLYYLKSALKGNAGNIIESLETTNDNYEVAWKTVSDRYENKRLIVNTHVSALFQLRKIEKAESQGLRDLIDCCNNHLGALRALKQPVDYWDTLIIHLITSKLDRESFKEWEDTRVDSSLPTLEELMRVLTRRCSCLESVERVYKNDKGKGLTSSNNTRFSQQKGQKTFTASSYQLKCHVCKGPHELYQCYKFLDMSVSDRFKVAKAANVCLNCLKTGHRTVTCRSGKCQKCQGIHNTKLHFEKVTEEQVANERVSTTEEEDTTRVLTTKLDRKTPTTGEVLLATAIITACDIQGKEHMIRVLLDSGSQSNLITSKTVTILGLNVKRSNVQLSGISQSTCKVLGTTVCKIKSRLNAFTLDIEVLVLPKLTGKLPPVGISINRSKLIHSAELADPEFDQPRSVDMILGAEIFYDLLCIGQVRLGEMSVIMQKTVFGWVVAGRVREEEASRSSYHVSAITTEEESSECLSKQLCKFWELEETGGSYEKRYTQEETKCELHFERTCFREISGRYCVQYPFRSEVYALGDSRQMAERRFLVLERRLSKDPELKKQYANFMKEYIELGHMEIRSDGAENKSTLPQVFLPHHAVLRAESTTTKLRVVFDGSAKTTTGKSLNEVMMIGPSVQEKLSSILLRFRCHKIAMTADIEKMYRQIKVDDDHCNVQNILWREEENYPLEVYQLKTITYGTAAAPFMATRTLNKLASDEKENFPLAAAAISDFYVDDWLSGARSLLEAVKLQKEMLKMCEQGKFRLRKWCANHDEIINNVKNADREKVYEFSDSTEQITKTLGIRWNPSTDEICYSVSAVNQLSTCTKRLVVSEMSKLFDPLGLVGPVVVTAKVFVQDLWRLQVKWDESLPINRDTAWKQYREGMVILNALKIPRCIINPKEPSHIQLHVFCDASETAFGACAYIRCMSITGEITCNLLTSKSRVAPIKKVTVPRLELCAALLGARLFNTVQRSWARIMTIDHSILWTDSSIVWKWICADSKTHQWKTFVANRVSEIQELTGNATWRHVRTADNPADCLSRGMSAANLLSCKIWWNGPEWLTVHANLWPKFEVEVVAEEDLEQRKETFTVTMNKENELLSRFSKLERLQRVTAYCFRAIANFRMGRQGGRNVDPLNSEELERALLFLIQQSQWHTFSVEFNNLRKGINVPNKSKLRLLAPFVDSEGRIRVGGRLQHTNELYDVKHPYILSATSPLTQLIIDYEHRRLLHAGPQLLLSSLRQRYWIIGVRKAVQRKVHECKRCYIWKLKTAEQLMGSLPASRVQPASAFHTCGVDYAGPFMIRIGHIRSRSTNKAYIALFVCMTTRALHNELVSALTSEAFLAALRRFVARRGCPVEINSDNGTNFVGAARELRELLESSELSSELHPYVAQMGIKWKFIPPNAPHFGGIWEAGIKSAKNHLKRIVGETILTFEEFSTLLCQIEAVLNSRPMFAESSEPTDLGVLTPGHFLIGKALTGLPDHDYAPITCLRTRWQLIQQMSQQFWKRWNKEYVQTLQIRPKWNNISTDLQEGTLVIIKEDNLPPLKWALGRIQQLHPGSDGLVRVATVKTAKTTIQRPITKLCPLPGQENSFQIESQPQSGAGMLKSK